MMFMNLCLGLACFKAPSLIKKAGLAKRGAIIFAFINLVTWVPLALVFLFNRFGISPGLITLLWFINVVPGMLLSFQKDNWLSNLIPKNTMGRYLGQRMAIKSAFYLGAFFLLGYLLDSLGKEDIAGFTVIFTIALGAVLSSFVIFTSMSEKKPAVADILKPETIRFSLPEYFSELKKKKLDTFITFTTFFYLTVGFSGPLYAVFMLNELHFSYLSFTLIISAEYLARVISAPIWGRFADKEGNIKVLGIVSRIIPLLPVCWLFCHNLGYLVLVQLTTGVCWGAFDLCTQSYLYKVAPQAKKLHYIIYTRCLILLFMAAGGLIGAFCIDGIFTTFGSKLLSIFWISGIARVIIVICLMPKLVDLAVVFGHPAKPPEVNPEMLQQALSSKRGQFYRQEQQMTNPVSRLQKITEMMAADIEEFSGRRKWTTPDKFKTPQPIPIVKPPDSALRLSQYRENMTARTVKSPMPVQYHSLRTNTARLELRYTLERQLKDLARQAESAMTCHGLEENLARLRQRYHLDLREDTATILAEKVLEHHEIELNIERLKQRYHLNSQSATSAASIEKTPVKTHKKPETAATGLYRDKVSWTKYVKESMNSVLQEIRREQPVPVMVSSRVRFYSPTKVDAGNLYPGYSLKSNPVLI